MDFISWTGAILLSFCGLPELFRSMKTRRCNLTWGFLLMWLFGELFILVPVLGKSLGAFLVFNYLVNIIVISVLIYFKLKSGPVSFAAGDIVTAFGNIGTVKSIAKNGMFLEVKFENTECTTVFTIDGKIHNWNNEPVLRRF